MSDEGPPDWLTNGFSGALLESALVTVVLLGIVGLFFGGAAAVVGAIWVLDTHVVAPYLAVRSWLAFPVYVGILYGYAWGFFRVIGGRNAAQDAGTHRWASWDAWRRKM